jgi:hypothetical protein
MMRTPRLVAAATLPVVLAGCGAGLHRDSPLPTSAPSLGPTPLYRPPSLSPRAARGLPIRGMLCVAARHARYGVHVELFAAGRVVLVAPGIGVAPPRSRTGAYVRGGRCSYPLRTLEPTGVVEVEGGARPQTVGHLFAVWGQPLSRSRMAGFRGSVRAYVGGWRWLRAPGAIPLRRHAEIVLEVGRYVRPHRAYRFPPGL